jgi:hypothetical protein
VKTIDPYNHESFGQCDLGAPDFWSVAKVETSAPKFTLSSLDGAKVSLADFIGKKHVLMEFGSIT